MRSRSPAAIAVETRLFAALAVLRAIVLVNTLVLTAYRADRLERPGAAAACLAVMIAWSAFATWAYAGARRRTPLLLAADLALAAALLLATPWVRGDDVSASLPGFWVISVLVAWAIHLRTAGGLVAGGVLAGCDLARQDIDASDYGNVFLLIVGGTILGYMCGSLQAMATERDVAQREAAVAAERARLARAVHDGVLQVLALVQRRGRELGGEAAELGRLAGEQERELRLLIRTQDDTTSGSAGRDEGMVDLTAELATLEHGGRVTVSTPGVAVELPVETARELLAAVRAALDNVRVHVGEQAPAWVLLQASAESVEISVRDDGPGIPPGRLEEAETQGRLGVSESIRGRLGDLGGTARVTSGSFGTEWELVVPRAGARPGSPRVAP